MTEEMIDHRFLRRDSVLYAPLRRLEAWIDGTAPAVFTSTAHTERLLLEEFGCKSARVQTLTDCVNATTFRPASTYDTAELATLRRELGIPPERKLVVYLGLLAEYQGISLLLEAMRRLVQAGDNVHLLLMGFPGVQFYQERARELSIGESVTFTGRIPYTQAPKYLALGDVAVAPKLSLTEGSGKLLNYMAVGLPTVAFDTPVAREYLGMDGVLAIPGDVDSLAHRLRTCLFPSADSAGLFARLGQRLRLRAIQQYSWEAAGYQILDTYRRLRGDAPILVATQTGWAVGQE
jgi:glycosyltransferase involved in cell wall biosynthesis